MYSDIDVITTRIVRSRVPQEYIIVQEHKVILNAITSVAVHPTFQLRELFVLVAGFWPKLITVISVYKSVLA